VCDCIRYKNALKHFIHLRSSSKRVTARLATWNPANWHENQMEIRSNNLLITQKLRTRAELVASWLCQSRCTVLWSSHARATGRTITGCVHNHEI